MGQEPDHDLAGSFAQGLKNCNQGVSWTSFLSGAWCPLPTVSKIYFLAAACLRALASYCCWLGGGVLKVSPFMSQGPPLLSSVLPWSLTNVTQPKEWQPNTFAVFYWLEATHKSLPHSRGGDPTRSRLLGGDIRGVCQTPLPKFSQGCWGRFGKHGPEQEGWSFCCSSWSQLPFSCPS